MTLGVDIVYLSISPPPSLLSYPLSSPFPPLLLPPLPSSLTPLSLFLFYLTPLSSLLFITLEYVINFEMKLSLGTYL